jgi:hypothetical protein
MSEAIKWITKLQNTGTLMQSLTASNRINVGVTAADNTTTPQYDSETLLSSKYYRSAQLSSKRIGKWFIEIIVAILLAETSVLHDQVGRDLFRLNRL